MLSVVGFFFFLEYGWRLCPSFFFFLLPHGWSCCCMTSLSGWTHTLTALGASAAHSEEMTTRVPITVFMNFHSGWRAHGDINRPPPPTHTHTQIQTFLHFLRWIIIKLLSIEFLITLLMTGASAFSDWQYIPLTPSSCCGCCRPCPCSPIKQNLVCRSQPGDGSPLVIIHP